MTKHFRADAFAPIELKGDETGDPAEIVTKALDGMQASLNEKLAEIEKKAAASLTGRLDKLEAALKRPAIHTGNADEASIERKAFDRYLRVGEGRMSADEVKALTVATDSAGGYLSPDEVGNELIKLLRQYSPLRQYAKVVSIGADTVKYPRRTGSTAATGFRRSAPAPRAR